jgi:hypothetical protein
MLTLARMFEVHAAYSLDKQLALGEMLKACRGWNFDMESGRITFGQSLSFPAQVLGTESEADGTWLWAWANSASGIPPRLLKAAEHLKRFGTENKVAELTEPELPLNKISGDQLAMIASGACKSDAFYRGAYKGGALYLLIEGPNIQKLVRSSAQRVATVFTRAISEWPLNHRLAFLNYLHFKGYRNDQCGDSITGTSPDGEQVVAEFDVLSRLTKIRALVKS